METRLLDWDSVFFERSVAKISIDAKETVDIKQEIASCKNNGCKLVYIFLDAGNEVMAGQIANVAGKPINEKLIFSITDVDPQKIKARLADELTVAAADDISSDQACRNQLLQLTLQAGAFSRFKIDPALNEKYFYDMYSVWTTAMLDDKSYRIVVAKHKDEHTPGITGFLSYKIVDHGYRIEFMSINEAYQKKGIGKALVKKMFEDIYSRSPVLVTTEIHRDNASAYHFFLSNKFSLARAVNIYHVHL